MLNRGKKLSVGLLFDDTLDSNDGVAQQVKRLGEYLTKNGHRVVYLCGETSLKEWSGGRVYSLSKNIRIKFNGNRLSMPILSSKKHIKEVLLKEKLDIIHVQMPYSPLLAQRVIRLAREDSVIIGTFHILPSGWLSGWGSRFLGLVQFFSLRNINLAVSVSSSAAAFAEKTMGLRSVVVPNMVDLSQFAAAKATSVESGKIVFLGRLVKRKGCEQLIRAFSVLSQTNPSASLVIAGDGPDRLQLQQLTQKLGVKDRVNFLGFIDEKDKPHVLASAQIACFPALYGESFGIVLIEAMAAGSEVVLAGDNPGYRCVMGEQPTLLINPRDTAGFVAKLVQLLRDKSLRQQLHDWQDDHVKQYDINVVGSQIIDLYTQAIAKRRKTIDN